MIKNLKNFHSPSSTLILILLVCTDLVFFALHVYAKLSPNVNNLMFYVDIEGSYGEIFQYIKWFWVVLLFVSLSFVKKSAKYISWALVFTYLLLDDSMQIHETFGSEISNQFDLVSIFGLRPQDIGELMVSGIAGLVLLPMVLGSYIKGSHAFKRMSRIMLILIFALFFFGIVVDTVHVMLNEGRAINAIMGFIEDGGEMIVASLMCYFVFYAHNTEEL